MYYIPRTDKERNFVARLAQKAGLSEEQAQKFLNALSEITKEDEREAALANTAAGRNAMEFRLRHSRLLGSRAQHLLSIPIVQNQDGSMTVDTSGFSLLTPTPRITPPKPKIAAKRRQPPRKGTPPGGYPGPSFVIKLNDWMGADLDLGDSALGRLRSALDEAGTPASEEQLGRFFSGGMDTLDEK